MLVCKRCGRQFAHQKDFLVETSRWTIDDQKNLWFRCSCKETLALPDGKHDWYSPSLVMSKAAASLFNQLASKDEIPHVQQSVIELQQLLLDPEADARRIAEVVKRDPMFAVEIIAQANNMRASGRSSITSLEHAVSYVGRDALSDIVMLASLKSVSFRCHRFTQDEFWQMAQVCGLIAETLAPNCGLNPEEAYLAGALCNIGKIVAAICLPADLDKLYLAVHDLNSLSAWRDAELRLGFPDHTLLGEIACRLWGLPDFVVEANVSHHDPGLASEDSRRLMQVVAVSNQLSHWFMLRPHLIDEPLMRKISGDLGMTEADLERVVTDTGLVRRVEKLRTVH